jgi:hypothetical protein
MKRILSIAAALAVSAAFIQAADDAKKPADPAAPAEKKPEGDKPKADPDKAFAKKDANSDGSISKEEFVAGAKDAAKAETAFAKRDKDGDGKISKEEFAGKGPKKDK